MRTVGAVMLAGLLAGCQADELYLGSGPKHLREVSPEVRAKFAELKMEPNSPIMIRIFKEESTLEVWKQTRSGRFALLEDFEICKWSGELGPKFKEGDRQAPEGFYEITPGLMNPNSSYHLAFNLGFPNDFDQAHNRTGSNLMVHGACSSRGCYAMTDQQVQDIYALARDSFKGGQRSFQVQAFPFRMTAENMARHRNSPHIEFWRMLKTGYDHFEVTRMPPKVDVCEKRYVFDATPLVAGVPFRATAQCPKFDVPDAIEVAVAAKQKKDEAQFQTLVAELDAKDAREKRWKETQTKIAAFVGNRDFDPSAPLPAGSDDAPAADAPQVAAAAPAATTPAQPGAITPPVAATATAQAGASAPAQAVAAAGETPRSGATAATPRPNGAFASLFTGQQTPSGSASAAAPAPASQSGEVAATAFAAEGASGQGETKGFLKRWFSFGDSAEETPDLPQLTPEAAAAAAANAAAAPVAQVSRVPAAKP
ncbi:L,D-transpeptidase family protein [Pannonibacter tanglangensis]|uniref:L,D-transpeptidase family protein n=1 Tax=Pannonibacter tanglangensis TaxID=2750084 RepID=UPI0015D14752|nr:murein L,D-transpeptidase family protein [Pannonibacter sp. XCT-53]